MITAYSSCVGWRERWNSEVDIPRLVLGMTNEPLNQHSGHGQDPCVDADMGIHVEKFRQGECQELVGADS
jgi:hypothetical protein